ncbi:hypothetical protein [Arthrobacter sp. NA-172]|uniref:hypothetical protein n=1 Tax=Arthrobacter sp. NA-172 TaxID=3367524 RepID=UPI003754A769
MQLDASSPFAVLLFQETSDDARNLLIGIASTMVTVIAVVLGLTVDQARSYEVSRRRKPQRRPRRHTW